MEQLYPVLFEEYSLHEGSGGGGAHRGGFGVNYRIRLRRGEARVSMVMDHGRAGPPGSQGGGAGGVNKVRVIRDGVAYVPPHLSKDQDIAIRAGDVIAVSTPGGGGFGAPQARPTEALERDVALGYYSEEEARVTFPRWRANRKAADLDPYQVPAGAAVHDRPVPGRRKPTIKGDGMQTDLVDRIASHPRYIELKHKRTTLGWWLSLAGMVAYYGFILLVAFDKPLLAQKLGSGVTTVGMPLGIAVIVFTIVITWYYVRRANSEFDPLTEQIVKGVVK